MLTLFAFVQTFNSSQETLMTDMVDPTQQTDVGYFKLNKVAMSLPLRTFGALEFSEDGYYVIHDTKERIAQVASILEGHGAFPCNDKGEFLDPVAAGEDAPEPAKEEAPKETAKERKAREKAEAEAEAVAKAAPEPEPAPAPASDEDI